jgi:hypothetical protein
VVDLVNILYTVQHIDFVLYHEHVLNLQVFDHFVFHTIVMLNHQIEQNNNFSIFLLINPLLKQKQKVFIQTSLNALTVIITKMPRFYML